MLFTDIWSHKIPWDLDRSTCKQNFNRIKLKLKFIYGLTHIYTIKYIFLQILWWCSTTCFKMDSSNPFDDSIFPEFSINNLNASNATSVITSSKSLCANDNRNHSIQVMLGLQQSDMIFSISPSDQHQMDEHHLSHQSHHSAEDINHIFDSTSPSMVSTVITTQTIKARPISPCTTTSQVSPSNLAQHMPKVTTPLNIESVTTTTSEEKIKEEVDTTCNVQTSGMT